MTKPRMKPLILLLCLMLALPLTGPAAAQDTQASVPGFRVVDSSRLELVSADVTVYEHEKTGALVMTLLNEDTNRTFNISFRTPTLNDRGIPHVFEHATLGGSRKYPSKSLFFNLVYQTYNTFINAMTTDIMTTYPLASLSEDQLLKYADYYTDSVFNPMLMEDESIFLEEAWRYAMADKEAPLTLAGTVYTEMQGAYTIQTDAMFNFKKTLFPGSISGNSYGGHPRHIPQMTWEDLKDYHDAYYHPSNSLTTLYGKLEQVPAFLSLLDGYFSAYERREFAQADPGYAPLSQAVQATYDFPVEASSDTTNGAVVYYGFLCPGATDEDEQVMDLLTTLLNEQSSVFQQEMKKQLPQASASVYYDNTTPDTAVVFMATGMNADQAPLFEDVVNQSLAHVKEKGFDERAVEAVAAATRLALLLTTENANVGPELLPSIAYMWTATGNINAYSEYVDNTANYVAFAQQGKYQELISKFLSDSPVTALAITQPVPGLKEQQDAALAEDLAARKAAMTDEQLDAIVAQTAKMGEKEADDSAQYVAQLQAVTVDSLPVERRIYDITDTTGEDGVRELGISAEVTGVGQALLLLDAAGLPQEDIHWFKLYTDLMGKLDTLRRDNADLAAQMTRYLYGREMRISVLSGEHGDECHPKLRVNFIAIDEDLAPAWDLVYEVLFETSLEDAAKVRDVVSQVKTALKTNITNNAYNVLVYRAFASAYPGFAYFNYANFLDYYAFLEQVEALLEQQPQQALDKLVQVREALRNRTNAITGFAGNPDSHAANQPARDGFLARLNAHAYEPAVYSFPAIPASEALVIDSAVQYNMLFATYEQLGMEDYVGSLDALTGLVSDAYLYPLLRDQYGAYGVIHAATDEGVFILSYRDPNIVETFDVYGSLAEKLATGELSEDTLQGFILSAYSGYALSQGELAGALSAMVNHADGRAQQIMLDRMQQLKEVSPEQIKAYSALYQALYEKGLRSTAGGAGAIEANKALYEQVLNPFSVKDTSGADYTDLSEEDWYYTAVRFILDNKLMSPADETTFGADAPATLGEYASSLFIMMGGGGTPEEAIATLSGVDALLPGEPGEVLTRNQIASQMGTFFTALGGDITAEELTALSGVSDADQIAQGTETAFNFLLTNKMMNLREDGSLAPQDNLTRAELAQILYVLATAQ